MTLRGLPTAGVEERENYEEMRNLYPACPDKAEPIHEHVYVYTKGRAASKLPRPVPCQWFECVEWNHSECLVSLL